MRGSACFSLRVCSCVGLKSICIFGRRNPLRLLAPQQPLTCLLFSTTEPGQLLSRGGLPCTPAIGRHSHGRKGSHFYGIFAPRRLAPARHRQAGGEQLPDVLVRWTVPISGGRRRRQGWRHCGRRAIRHHGTHVSGGLGFPGERSGVSTGGRFSHEGQGGQGIRRVWWREGCAPEGMLGKTHSVLI